MALEEKRAIVHELFQEWYSVLLYQAYRNGRSMELAEDAVQEAFLSLYRALVAEQKVERPFGWLVCVLRRHIARRRKQDSLQQELDESLYVVDSAQHTGGGYDNSDMKRLLSVVSPREAEALLLRVQDLTYKEIGQALGISTNSVKTMLARGLSKMRTEFGKRAADSTGTGGWDYVSSKTL